MTSDANTLCSETEPTPTSDEGDTASASRDSCAIVFLSVVALVLVLFISFVGFLLWTIRPWHIAQVPIKDDLSAEILGSGNWDFKYDISMKVRKGKKVILRTRYQFYEFADRKNSDRFQFILQSDGDYALITEAVPEEPLWVIRIQTNGKRTTAEVIRAYFDRVELK